MLEVIRMSRDWKVEIKRAWGIDYLEDPRAAPERALWITRCSKTKRLATGFPRDLYVSQLNLFFYGFVHAHRKRYGIVSDKYGLHLDIEKLPYYDIHPSELSEKQKELLGQKIRKKAQSADFQILIFYNNSPLMSKPYFEILSASGLEIFFVTRLPQANPIE